MAPVGATARSWATCRGGRPRLGRLQGQPPVVAIHKRGGADLWSCANTAAPARKGGRTRAMAIADSTQYRHCTGATDGGTAA
ncbi:hypothetical protein B296_00024273 [Ensete ventricosum]|uniref:Uncharacterized protein n=1 Tax=Ensete ventricosum TaxID=4639 RepID=A0A426Z5E5_ENSVE|nr:hypothetical protein B296_00024273 [Ensete ventricosum]